MIYFLIKIKEKFRAAIICQRKSNKEKSYVKETSETIENIISEIVEIKKDLIEFVYITEGSNEKTDEIDLKITINDETDTKITGEFDIIFVHTCPLVVPKIRKGVFAWIEKSLKNKGKVYLTGGRKNEIFDFSDRLKIQKKEEFKADLVNYGLNYTNNTNKYNIREITRIKN